jgi:hypothetical protein
MICLKEIPNFGITCHKVVCLWTKIVCTDVAEAKNLEGLKEKLVVEDSPITFCLIGRSLESKRWQYACFHFTAV